MEAVILSHFVLTGTFQVLWSLNSDSTFPVLFLLPSFSVESSGLTWCFDLVVEFIKMANPCFTAPHPKRVSEERKGRRVERTGRRALAEIGAGWGWGAYTPQGPPEVPEAAVDGAPLRDRILLQFLPKTGMGAKAAA